MVASPILYLFQYLLMGVGDRTKHEVSLDFL